MRREGTNSYESIQSIINVFSSPQLRPLSTWVKANYTSVFYNSLKANLDLHLLSLILCPMNETLRL